MRTSEVSTAAVRLPADARNEVTGRARLAVRGGGFGPAFAFIIGLRHRKNAAITQHAQTSGDLKVRMDQKRLTENSCFFLSFFYETRGHLELVFRVFH